jgi:Tfp pilus assembly protein PilN
MTRINYLEPSRRLPRLRLVRTIAIDDRIRGPLAALSATILVTLLTGLLEFDRLRVAQAVDARAAAHLAAVGTTLQDIATQASAARRATRVFAQIAAIRAANFRHADDLVWIGNHLPPQTALSSVRYEDGTYSLEGSSERPAAVAAAMIALHVGESTGTPQLVSLRADDGAALNSFRFSLKLQTHR